MKYWVFGTCFITGAVVLVCLHWGSEWRASRQKRQQEMMKFWHHMERLNIDPAIISEVMSNMKSTEDFEKANHRLSKPVRKSNTNQSIQTR